MPTQQQIRNDTQILNSVMKGRYWLAFGSYASISPMAGGSQPYSATIDRVMSLIKWTQAAYVATTNNGSHYWTIGIYRFSDSALIKQLATSSMSVNTWSQLSATTFDIASLSPSDLGVFVSCNPVGTPGNLYLPLPALEINI